ncbi:MAG: hypothetical protein P1P74_05850 [Desulfuromonadales bacterium]|nr:hypothetical protein [Desulfuromonadales bacterium]MDT8423720.1 hypothetical protein [Desulfuromonadales bacterium]
MALVGSPKKLVEDIADGYFMLSPPLLRNYHPAALKIILANLALVTRLIRAEKIPLEDIMALKKRNMKLSRLRQTEQIIQTYCRKHRIPC